MSRVTCNVPWTRGGDPISIQLSCRGAQGICLGAENAKECLIQRSTLAVKVLKKMAARIGAATARWRHNQHSPLLQRPLSNRQLIDKDQDLSREVGLWHSEVVPKY